MYFQLKNIFKKYLYHIIKHTFNLAQLDWLVRNLGYEIQFKLSAQLDWLV